MINPINQINGMFKTAAQKLESVSLLALRIYVSWIFFPAGMLKIKDWDTTLFLFEEEYQVPIFSPELAAWLGTAGELLLPILLVFGFLTRPAALGLFVVNIVAVISLSEVPPAALAHHLIWGLSLAVIFVFGGGKVTLDHVFSNLGNVSTNHSGYLVEEKPNVVRGL
jgi:putative oxidoreductase